MLLMQIKERYDKKILLNTYLIFYFSFHELLILQMLLLYSNDTKTQTKRQSDNEFMQNEL